MKFGLMTINMGLDSGNDMLAVAQAAEAAGFESLWTAEHLMFPVDLQSSYPYTKDGKLPIPPETSMIEPFIALAAIAAQTSKIRLGTGISLLAAHNPLVFAKQAASLDFVSGGRVILGVGLGWMREDFEMVKIPFKGRGARLDDYITAIRKVWTGDTVEHESEYLSWRGFKSYPLPIQPGGIPITIGGRGEKNFERVAKHRTGWFGPDCTLAELRNDLAQLRTICARNGRDFAEVEISVKRRDPAELDDLDALKQFTELGVHRLWCSLFGSTAERIETIKRLSDHLIAQS